MADLPSKGATLTEPYIHLGNPSDDFLDIFDGADMMAGAGAPSPYIKDEPDDLFGSPHPQRFVPDPQHHHHPHHHRFAQPDSHLLAGLSHSHGSDGSIDPAELTMAGETLSSPSGAFASAYPSFGAPPSHLNFHLGNSGIADDELLDLGNLNETQDPQAAFRDPDDFFATAAHVQRDAVMSTPFQDHHHHHAGSLEVHRAGAVGQVYSPGADGSSSVQRPFGRHHQPQHVGYDALRQPQHPYGQSMKAAPSPSSYRAAAGVRPHPGLHPASLDQRAMHVAARSRPPHGFEPNGSSQSRSPLTPKTPAMGIGGGSAGLTLGTPDSGSFPQPIHTHAMGQHRHHRNLSNQWDSNSGSLHSYVDSPLSSPGHASHHPPISDVLGSGKPASLPAKVESGGQTGGPAPTFQSQEAKRRRRRESHNMVERRRRDNINERIQELSHLVPPHRLEDERVRKHLMNNSPLSPTLGPTGMSPPQAATSLLAGGAGRRAAGSITTGIPVEDKDKGPNKGDILNGSVSWTRDLMWALHGKMQQESELADYISSLGGQFPFEQTEEDRRMRTELSDAMERNNASTFSYSRAPGTGLRVPKHTNLAGDPIHSMGLSPQSLSPVNMNGESRHASVGQGHGPFSSDQNSIGFKEEDEYGMDMT